MVGNRRGWIRILEATIAVLVISGVLIVLYVQQSETRESGSYLFNLQSQILKEISSDEALRDYTLKWTSDSGPPQKLIDLASSKIPAAFGHSIKVCKLNPTTGGCGLNANEIRATQSKEVFVEETIISSNLQTYDPKKVRLYIWDNR